MVEVFFKMLILCWILRQVSLHIRLLRVNSLFSIVLWSFWSLCPVTFKTRHFGVSSFRCWLQGLGCLMWGIIPSPLEEELCVFWILPCRSPCLRLGTGQDSLCPSSSYQYVSFLLLWRYCSCSSQGFSE